MKQNDMLLLAGAGLLAWFLLKPKTAAPLSTGMPGANSLPVYNPGPQTTSTAQQIANTGSMLSQFLPKLFPTQPLQQPDIIPTNTTGDSIQEINAAGYNFYTSGGMTPGGVMLSGLKDFDDYE